MQPACRTLQVRPELRLTLRDVDSQSVQIAAARRNVRLRLSFSNLANRKGTQAAHCKELLLESLP